MFKVIPRPVVTWPVVVEMPVDGGKTVAQPAFDVSFELITDSEREELFAEDGSGHAMLRRVVKGWDETQIGDDTGAPLKFSPAALAMLLNIPYVRLGLMGAFNRASLGVREKN